MAQLTYDQMRDGELLHRLSVMSEARGNNDFFHQDPVRVMKLVRLSDVELNELLDLIYAARAEMRIAQQGFVTAYEPATAYIQAIDVKTAQVTRKRKVAITTTRTPRKVLVKKENR